MWYYGLRLFVPLLLSLSIERDKRASLLHKPEGEKDGRLISVVSLLKKTYSAPLLVIIPRHHSNHLDCDVPLATEILRAVARNSHKQPLLWRSHNYRS